MSSGSTTTRTGSTSWSTESWWRRPWDSRNPSSPDEYRTFLNNFVDPRGLGLVAGEGGTIQLDINLVRIPDVSFISWERVPGGEIPQGAGSPCWSPTWPWRSSAGATPARRWRKSSRNTSRRASAWSGSFGRGAGSSTSTRRRTNSRRLTASMRLDGGDVLPGFSVQVGELFQMPKRPARTRANRRRTGPTREEERAAARSLKGLELRLSPLTIGRGVCTDHAHVAGPVSPGDLRADRGAPRSLRDLVCRVTGMHPTDAVQWLARAPGTWPKPLEESEVRRLLDGLLRSWGSPPRRGGPTCFPELSPPRIVHRAACMNEGFRIEGLRGEPTHWVPWDRIEMICAGRITVEDEFRNVQSPAMAVDGRFRHPRPGPDEAPADRAAEPARRGFRAIRSARSSSSAATRGSPSASSRTR